MAPMNMVVNLNSDETWFCYSLDQPYKNCDPPSFLCGPEKLIQKVKNFRSNRHFKKDYNDNIYNDKSCVCRDCVKNDVGPYNTLLLAFLLLN